MRLINRIDRAVVRSLIHELLKDGFSLGVHDGEEFVIRHSRDGQAVMEKMFSVDEETLTVYREVEGKPKRFGSVFLVYGESGWDVICDHSVNLSPQIDRLNPLTERFEALLEQREAA